jgi:toxin FitB
VNGFLLDTSVLSTFAPDRPELPVQLRDWIMDQGQRDRLFVSTIVILETQRGIAKLLRAGGKARADRLEHWLAGVLVDFKEQLLSIDPIIARAAGELEDASIAAGRSTGLADILVAATAQVHSLTVLTTNVRHFAVLATPHLDPFAERLPT